MLKNMVLKTFSVNLLTFAFIFLLNSNAVWAWTENAPLAPGEGRSYSTIGRCTAGALGRGGYSSGDWASIELWYLSGPQWYFYLNNRRFVDGSLNAFPGLKYSGNEAAIETACNVSDVEVLREEWVFSDTQTWVTTEGAYLALAFTEAGIRKTWSASIRQSAAGVLVLNSEVVSEPTPQAFAGVDMGPFASGRTVSLDGTGSRDPETSSGDGLQYLWRQISGVTVELVDATTPTPSFVAPVLQGSFSETLIFGLVVSNAAGTVSGEDKVNVVITTDGSSIIAGFDAGPCTQNSIIYDKSCGPETGFPSWRLSKGADNPQEAWVMYWPDTRSNQTQPFQCVSGDCGAYSFGGVVSGGVCKSTSVGGR